MWLNISAAIICFIGFVIFICHKNEILAFIQLCFMLLNIYVCFITSTKNSASEETSSKQNIEAIQPTAKDVYDGKTTLRIVYEDSIPVDTQIVFKKEFIKNKIYDKQK